MQDLRMKNLREAARVLVIAVIALFSVAPHSLAAGTTTQETTAKDVQKEMEDAAHAIKAYSVEQKDDALKKAQQVLEDLDETIAQLETNLHDNWNRMDEASRQKARETLTYLRAKRNEVAEWYGGLKHSSSNSWDHVKTGFADSFKVFSESLHKAKDEFK
jgi:acyl-CoA reductase-like NAD-dependent aldehyde dehydrogenase